MYGSWQFEVLGKGVRGEGGVAVKEACTVQL
jgi:hypothetical protein